jgi:hypothetical protein
MRILIVLAAMALASPSAAQQFQAPTPQGSLTGAKVGQLEVKAYHVIPKAKTAVQLTSDTALARNIRREVMVRLARRGNEVGFSGGNVMRMDVSYFDLSGGGNAGSSRDTNMPSANALEGPGSNPRPDLEGYRIERSNNGGRSTGPVLRLNLTLYSTDNGNVLWAASASCYTQAGLAEAAGLAIVDAIFDDADRNRIADAGCPL